MKPLFPFHLIDHWYQEMEDRKYFTEYIDIEDHWVARDRFIKLEMARNVCDRRSFAALIKPHLKTRWEAGRGKLYGTPYAASWVKMLLNPHYATLVKAYWIRQTGEVK